MEADRRPVLAVPSLALRQDRADPYVLMAQGDRIVVQTVRIGSRGTADGVEWVEVTQGLAEGTRVLSGTVGNLPEGVRWKPASSPGAGGNGNGNGKAPARAASAAL